METIVWSFDRNVSPLDHECLVITRESPRWKSVACDIKDKFVAACYGHITNIPENPEDDTVYSAIWKLGNGTSMEADANASCEQNFEYSVPATGYENQLLYALLHNASDSFKGVWINHQKIKSFMSSNHHEQDQEEDKQEHEVLPSDVLNGMLAIE
jgi:hypothetical protein